MGNGTASQTAKPDQFHVEHAWELGFFEFFVPRFWDVGFVQVRGSS